MGNDACRRAVEAVNELCGNPREDHDSNTFYVQVSISQGREVSPEDTDEVASVLEEAARSIGITLGLSGTEAIETQIIQPDESRRNLIEGYMKIPVERMQVRAVSQIDQSIIESIEAEQVDVGRGIDNIDLVDRSVVARKVPEMLGPPIEDVEMM